MKNNIKKIPLPWKGDKKYKYNVDNEEKKLLKILKILKMLKT